MMAASVTVPVGPMTTEVGEGMVAVVVEAAVTLKHSALEAVPETLSLEPV
jgi:hypothetical protein